MLGIVAVAAVARLSWLDLMEFKYDEANACRLAFHVLGYSEPGVGRFFPTAGLVSSVGVPNPPLFVYLVAIPLAIVHSPIAVAAAIAAANVVSVALVYVLGKRCFGRFVGLGAASLLAVSPWAIVFSRKIWAQDLLPLCTTLFALQLHALLVERRVRAPFWLIVIAAAATELHFSAWVLVAVAVLALVSSRSWVSRRWTAAGLLVAVGSYVPFLAFHLHQLTHVGHGGRAEHPSVVSRFESSIRLAADIVGGGNLHFLIGHTSALGGALSVLLGVAALVGLVLAARRTGSAGLLGRLFLVWCLLPSALLILLPVHTYIHYFIVILPLPYIGAAYLVERLARRDLPRALAVAALVCALAVVDTQIFRTIIDNGGAPGDYGIAYKYKRDATAFALRQAGSRPVQLGFNLSFAQGGALRTYRLLIWNADIDGQPARRGSPARFLLLSRFATPHRLLQRYAGGAARFGPLSVARAGTAEGSAPVGGATCVTDCNG